MQRFAEYLKLKNHAGYHPERPTEETMPDIPTEKRLLAEANRYIAEVERILKDAETQLRKTLRQDCHSEERYKQIAFMKEILQTMEHHRDFIINEIDFVERPSLSPLLSVSGGFTAAQD